MAGPTRTDPIVPEGDEPEKDPRARETTLLEAALAYAARGWPVLPCQPDKKPIGLLVPNGLLDATTDSARIRKWCRAEPEALIGGATGSEANKIVLDVDVKAGVDGYATLAELEAKHGPLPETVTATTPSGGRHYYFSHPGFPVKSGAGLYGPGLDSRADGAYAILPPSAVTNAGAYEWLEGHGPDEIELAPAPDWVAHPQAFEAEAMSSGSLLSSLLREPPGEGGRHTWLTRVAGCYALTAIDHATYAELVRTTNWSLPKPLPETEAEGIVSGIWDKHQAQADEPPAWETPIPFDSFDPPAFPTEVLPAVLRDYVSAEALATQTPEDLVGVIVLGCVSAAVGGKVHMQPQPEWDEPSHLYLAVALGPANRKSSVFSHAVKPIQQYERELLEGSRSNTAHIENEREIIGKRIKDAQKTAAVAEDAVERGQLTLAAQLLVDEREKLVIPPEPRLLADSVTPEKLASMLVEQDGVLALMSAEPDLFEIITGRYSSGTPNLEPILKGHAGDEIRVDRQSRRAEIIRSTALTVVLALQPEVLRGLLAKPHLRGRGVLARFLYALPVSPVGHRMIRPPSVPTGVRQQYVDLIDTLLRLTAERDGEGNRRPVLLEFEAGVEAPLDLFSGEIEAMLGLGGDLAVVAEWGGKLPGAVVRLAQLLHMAEWDSRGFVIPVSAETLEAAVTLGRYFITHAKAAFSLMGADEVVADAEHILTWLLGSQIERFDRREVYRHSPTRFDKAAKVDAPLRLLVDRSFIREVPKQSTQGKSGRKPGPSFEVNPQLLGRN